MPGSRWCSSTARSRKRQRTPCCCSCKVCSPNTSARIVERSRRGKRHPAQAGAVSVLGRAPYGYRYIGRVAGGGMARFEVVEDKAAVVRRIFGWVAQERISLTMVCQRLFEAGVPNPTGNARWDRSTVWVLLSNPAYAGQALFGKVTSHSLASNTAPGTRPCSDPQIPVPPGPDLARKQDRHPGAAAGRGGAVRGCAGAAGGEPAALSPA